MKNILVALSILALCSSCKQEKETEQGDNFKDLDKLIGTWKMVYAEIREKDSVEVKDLEISDFIKIINETHFAFFNQDHNNEALFYGGGGTYRLEENHYTEKLNFTGVEGLRGHDFSFTLEMNGDTLVQYGLEEVEELNIKRRIMEKYVRVE
ncbi:lipocalin family protein [Spongiimicrobium salis]|uniref:lipocalin family protein n=1 Tax=Spongiimicrobium salis TaxID=1667022 RepID=UPI00374DDA6D